MASSSQKSPFLRGFVAGLPFVLSAGPFGLLFGLVATEAGLRLYEVMSMSVLVIAGAAQFAALAQMNDAAPVAMVLAAGLAVNARMAIYSASLAPHLGPAPFWQRGFAAYILIDNAYAVGIAEFDRHPAQPVAAKMAYFIGCAVPVWVIWYLSSYLGATLGQGFPDDWGLDFAVPIAFLAVVAPMLKTLAHLAAASVSLILGLALTGLPYGSGLLLAALFALLVGAEVERRMGRR